MQYGNGTSTVGSSISGNILANNVFVYGARFGIHVLGGNGTAGLIFAGHMIGGGFDQVQTIVQADQYARIGGFVMSSQYWFAAVWNSSAPIANGAVYANGASDFDVSFDDIWATVDGTAFNLQQTGGFVKIRNMQANICAGVTSSTCWFVTSNGNASVQGHSIVGEGSGATVVGDKDHRVLAHFWQHVRQHDEFHRYRNYRTGCADRG